MVFTIPSTPLDKLFLPKCGYGGSLSGQYYHYHVLDGNYMVAYRSL